MATNFYFRSLSISNFRSFKSLRMEPLRRINIIGGFNGVGKTALLEALFFVMDRRNPVAIMKPLIFRRLETTAPINPEQFLYNSDVEEASIKWMGRTGKFRMELTSEAKPNNVPVSFEGALMPAGFPPRGIPTQTVDLGTGISIRTYEGDGTEEEENVFTMAAPNGLTGTMLKQSQKNLPQSQYISTSTRQSTKELATALSNLYRAKRLSELVAHMKVLQPHLRNLTTLQEGDEVQIYAELDNETILPIQYMGDGFQNLLHTVSGLMNCPGGVLLLDEIDAAMHYSIVTNVWRVIAEVASKENCQIFATTHSRECINSAARGISSAGKASDFQYLRLELEDDIHRVINYTMEELVNAEEYNIEIR